ncbi:hypothetical protein ACHAXH_004504 [Discostella pseudostelligera]
MTFVYTGKGRRQAQKDDAPPEQKLCAKQACAIQWCLAKRDHKEELCQHIIDEWQTCCEKVRAAVAAAASVSSDSSSAPNNETENRGVEK